MKSYWKLVTGAALVVALLGLLLVPPRGEGLMAGLAVLAAGYLGFKLVARVDILARQQPMRVVALLVLSATVIGIGAFLHITVLWSLGVAGMLVLPFARMAKDCWDDERVDMLG